MTEPIVETRYGRVRGREQDGVLAFTGVTYGAPTDGENRFKPPRTPEPWAGMRDALEIAPIAYQHRKGPGTRPELTMPMTEDCLTLNVWTSSLSGSRPVLVWFHGGGFAAGQAVVPYSHGASLAARGDVVIVSVTHRLALLGFLNLEEIGGEEYAGSGNASSLDLQLALEWVRDNIASFGGDPAAVTIHGHSGGGGKVAALASMPGARGLFRSAIVHGGPPFGFKDHAAATDSAEQALALLGISANDLSALSDLHVQRLMEVQEQLGVTGAPGPHGMRFAPAIGTAVLPADPYQAFAAGTARDVSFMTGTSLDEARAAIMAFPHYLSDPDMGDGELLERLRPGLDDPSDAELLVERYRDIVPAASNSDVFFDVLSDQFTIRSLRLADAKQLGDGQDAWVYFCTANQESPHRAYHGIQMPLFFDNVVESTPAGATAAAVSAELVRFASGTLGQSEHWKPYHRDEPNQLVIDERGIRSERGPIADRIAAWDGVIVTPRTDPWTTLWL